MSSTGKNFVDFPLSLRPDQAASLKAICHRKSRTQQSILREAVDNYLRAANKSRQ